MRAVVSSTGAQLIAHVVTLAATLVISALLSRYLGPAGFGRYALIFAYVNLVSAIVADIGLGQIAARDASQTPEALEEILASAGALQAAASVVAYLLLIVAAQFMMDGAETIEMIVAGSVILFLPLEVLSIVLQIQLKLTRLAWIGLATALVRMLLIGVAVFAGASLTTFVALTTVGTLLRYVLLPFPVRKSVHWRALRPRPGRYRRLLIETLPLGLATSCLSVMTQAPILVLGWLSSPEQVGYFSAALRITSNVSIPAVMLATTLYPVFARLAHADERACARLAGQVMRYMVLIALPVFSSGLIAGSWLLGLIYGEAFGPASPAFSILMAQAGMVFPLTIAAHLLIAMGRQKTDLLALGTGAVIVAALCLALAQTWGAVGAAVSLLAGTVAAGCWMFASIYRRFGPRLDLRGLGLLGSGIVLAVVTAGVSTRFPLPLAGCLGLVVYGIAVLVFRAVTRADLQTVGVMLRARGHAT